MTEKEKLKNILINENAYFFQKKSNRPISSGRIAALFVTMSSVKIGKYLLKKVNEEYKSNGSALTYSICVFKYHTPPTFIEKFVANWVETKIAYLLIIDYKDYLVISRKNVSKIQDFLKDFKQLPYETLSTLFVDDDTNFEKFSLKNLNVSDKAIREKSIEAIDLKENFSALGANNYIVNSLRVSNNNEKISMMLNSSRINKFGKKTGIEAFCNWSVLMVDKIKAHVVEESFLSIFAEPQDYTAMRATLVPISVLFNFGDIYNDFEAGRITAIFLRIETDKGPVDRPIDLFRTFSKAERLSEVIATAGKYEILNSIASDLELKLNEASITLRSQKLRKIILRKDNGNEVQIVDYLNNHHAFIVNFDSIDLVYSNRKLFRDSKLLGSISQFMKIFKPFAGLNTITSEKGTFTATSTQFTTGSQFRFVEDTVVPNHEFLICDDLGREWADHIGIDSERVVFYHSKHKTSRSSASAFQDIVGQALKNLGNLSPQSYRIDEKTIFWKSDYVSKENGATQISRLRHGTSVDDAVATFKNAINSPYFKKEIVLVVSFISKAQLEGWLEDLQNGVAFGERNEVIQILWFISSLISNCIEANAEVSIYCKP